jgi:hypothetical protein
VDGSVDGGSPPDQVATREAGLRQSEKGKYGNHDDDRTNQIDEIVHARASSLPKT